MADSLSVLILTAGFGDGHNSAARNLAEAIAAGAPDGNEAAPAVWVVDLFEDAAPITGAFYKWVYRQMINHLPGLWQWLFNCTKSGDFGRLWWDRFVGVREALKQRLLAHRPHVVILTYPVYPYFFDALNGDVPRPQAVWMAVTDSITIHPIWLHGHVDRIYVTDKASQGIVEAGLARPAPVEVSGFPVAPCFAGFRDRSPVADAARLKVLYFATTAVRHVRPTLRGLLRDLPKGAELTIVMGRHQARLSGEVESLMQAFPAVSVRKIGWTCEVPQLLMEHDVVVSKAGGATVHECFAAGVPVIVNYIIPGQEEGNVELLETLGCGCRSLEPEETGSLIAALVREGRLAEMRSAMALHRRPDGALRIARDLFTEFAF